MSPNPPVIKLYRACVCRVLSALLRLFSWVLPWDFSVLPPPLQVAQPDPEGGLQYMHGNDKATSEGSIIQISQNLKSRECFLDNGQSALGLWLLPWQSAGCCPLHKPLLILFCFSECTSRSSCWELYAAGSRGASGKPSAVGPGCACSMPSWFW